MLHEYSGVLLDGVIVTLKLSLSALILCVVLGLLAASAKLSSNWLLRSIGTLYTTLIRSIPDLVLLLLLFYSVQIWLNNLTDFLGWKSIGIDPMLAGIIALGVIYGAYFAETFRGAFISVPVGQIEAGRAYGLTSWQRFRLIMFPQMMRFALPGLGNNWLILVKSTALVSIIGLADVVKAAQDIGKSTSKLFFFLIAAAMLYLVITSVSSLIFAWLERRYAVGLREPTL